MTSSNIPILPENDNILNARSHWQFNGSARPDFAQATQPGEVSVWDFPRPPLIEKCSVKLEVLLSDQLIAATDRGVRVLETAGAPTYYFPPEDVDSVLVTFGEMVSMCEWKGVAQAIHVDGVQDAGWRYVRMFPGFAELYQWPSFYPTQLDCRVDGHTVSAQPGGYYGGWVTPELRGPIKGEPNSQGW